MSDPVILLAALPGILSCVWILVQFGDRLWGKQRARDSVDGTLAALTSSQKELADQILQIAQVVRDLANSLRTADQLASMRHEIIARELTAIRQSIDSQKR